MERVEKGGAQSVNFFFHPINLRTGERARVKFILCFATTIKPRKIIFVKKQITLHTIADILVYTDVREYTSAIETNIKFSRIFNGDFTPL